MVNSDIFSRYSQLKSTAIALKAKAEQIKRSYAQCGTEYKDLGVQIERSTRDLKVLEQSSNVLKEIVDRVSEEQVQRIVTLVTHALREIFYDKQYSLEISVSDKRGTKCAELYLTEVVENEEGKKSLLRVPFEDSIGGGVLTVVGFILRVYFLGYFNQSPLILCDEYFSQVSDQYIPTLMAFIRQLANLQKFIFVCIFHDDRFKSYGDRFFVVNDGHVEQQSKGVENVEAPQA